MAESKDNIGKRIYRFYTNRVVTNKKAGNSRSGYLPSMFFTYTKFPFFDRVC